MAAGRVLAGRALDGPFHTLLIDLDGTLTDPFPGITGSVRHALAAMGREAPPAEDLAWCIGPPVRENFARLLETQDPALIEQGVARYRERYGTVGLFENTPYDGALAMVAGLKSRGLRLILATSKAEIHARRIVEHYGFAAYLDAVHGSELDGTRSDKIELIAHILARHAIPAAGTAMLGDRLHDMRGARGNGLPGIGALWGYGGSEELEAAGAAALADRPVDVPDLLAI